MNLFTKQKESQSQKTNLWLQKGKGHGEINQEFGIRRYKVLHVKLINSYCIAQGSIFNIINNNGKEFEIYICFIYIYITESLCRIPETNIAL